MVPPLARTSGESAPAPGKHDTICQTIFDPPAARVKGPVIGGPVDPSRNLVQGGCISCRIGVKRCSRVCMTYVRKNEERRMGPSTISSFGASVVYTS
eukprot:1652308-Pyramimonas_sp.AAC.1